jgi:sRNA-binding carbon storage regulator CsrA
MINKKTLKFMKNRKFLASKSVFVNLTRKKGKSVKIPAKRFIDVLEWKDVLKSIRIEKEEIIDKIKSNNLWTMAEIRDEELKEWGLR